MIEFIDPHCHIHAAGQNTSSTEHTTKKWHDAGYDSAAELAASAKAQGVTRLICVGTDVEDSQNAVELANKNQNCWASVGVHPHEARNYFRDAAACRNAKHFAPPPLWAQSIVNDSSAPSQYKKYGSVRSSSSSSSERQHECNCIERVRVLAENPRVVAIGECGLDYFYEHSPKKEQRKMLEALLDVATQKKLPVIFHVRRAFNDFWPILDNFKHLSGVLHSYTDDDKNLKIALERGLFIGLNGIITFTREEKQLDTTRKIPLNRLLVETDAPYLTPVPLRGKVCKPEHVKLTTEFLSQLRGESVEEIASQTTKNTLDLFKLN